MTNNIAILMRKTDNLSTRIKDQIIEEWQVSESIKNQGVAREQFISIIKKELPRLCSDFGISGEETFLRIYYDNNPFWERTKQ